MREEVLAFLRSAPNSKTSSTAIQTTIITLQWGDLAVAELVNNILREVVEAGESKARDRELEFEIAGAMAAMLEEEVWSGPVTKREIKKAELELWQALETLDIKDAREAAKEIARKEKQKEAIAKKDKASKTKKITEFFKRCGGNGGNGGREEPPNKRGAS